MIDALILSDTVLYGEVGNSRYMGPYAIASSLRAAGYRAAVLDYFTRFKTQAEFFEYIAKILTPKTKVVGVSSTFLAPFVRTLEPRAHRSVGLDRYYAGELFCESGDALLEWTSKLKAVMRARAPSAKLVLGGVKSQYAVWRADYYRDFDHVVLGAGDRVVLDIIRAVENGTEVRERDFNMNLNGRRVVDNSLDLNEKICPETLLCLDDALSAGEAMPLEVARGCIFNCKFCHYEKKQSIKKPTDVLRRELLRNYEQFGTTAYLLSDDCFNDHPRKVEEYCELFLSLPFTIEWTAYARVDVAVAFPHTIDLMVRAGARGLYWGIESFDAEVARRAGKGTPPEKVKSFLIDFHSRYRDQCLMEGSFIVGLPGETEDSLKSTRDWILENDVFDFATFGPLGLMPYSASLDKLVVDFAEYSRNPEKFGFEEVSFKPHYWRHAQMDSTRAAEIASEMAGTWRAKKKPGLMRTVWFYPHMRTLGFSYEETREMMRDHVGIERWTQEIASRFERHVARYHHRLYEQLTYHSAVHVKQGV